MADTTITIPDLGSLTSGQASDLLLATRGTTGYKMLLSDLAKYMVETYNSSSLAGSAQSVKNALDSLNSRRAIRYANTQGLTQTLYSALASRQVVTFSGGTCQLDLTETFAALNTNGVAACICSFSENTSGVITASLFTNSTKILSLWAKKVSDGSAFEGTVNINIIVFFVS